MSKRAMRAVLESSSADGATSPKLRAHPSPAGSPALRQRRLAKPSAATTTSSSRNVGDDGGGVTSAASNRGGVVDGPSSSSADWPAPHRAMLARWLALETALAFFGRRGETPLLSKLALAVANACGKRLSARHLGQMLALWPRCYRVRKVRRVSDDRHLHSMAGGGGTRGQVHFDLHVGVGASPGGGDSDGGGATEEGQSGEAAEAAAAAAGDGPANTGGVPPVVHPPATSIARSPKTNGVFVSRNQRIRDVLATLAAAAAAEDLDGMAVVGTAETGDHREEEEDLGVVPAPLPDLTPKTRNKEAAAAAATPGETSKSDQQGAATAAAASGAAGEGGGDTGASSSSSYSCSNSSATDQQSGSEPPPLSRADALRARVAAKAQSRAAHEAAGGGEAGRARRRLCSQLPRFCDCLHSYLVQRRAAAVGAQALVHALRERLPRPAPSRPQVAELLALVLQLAPHWARTVTHKALRGKQAPAMRAPPASPPPPAAAAAAAAAAPAAKHAADPTGSGGGDDDDGDGDDRKMIQFNGSVKYAHVRALATEAARRGDLPPPPPTTAAVHPAAAATTTTITPVSPQVLLRPSPKRSRGAEAAAMS